MGDEAEGLANFLSLGFGHEFVLSYKTTRKSQAFVLWVLAWKVEYEEIKENKKGY